MSRTITKQSIRSYSSKGAQNSESRRNGSYETPFADDMPKGVTISRNSWLGKWLDWISPDSESLSEYLKSGGKSIGSFAALFKGVPWLIGAAKKVFSRDSSSSNSNNSADAAAIAALNASGANISSDKSSSIWSQVKNSLLGSSQSANLSGLLSSLTGIGTELGSSILNYQNQVKLLDKQNAYNTPANQMERFKDAGLNPNLVYGLGSNGNQPSSGSIAPVDFSTAQRESKMAMLNYKSDLAQKQASINLMDKQASEADERAQAQRLSNSVYMQSWYMNMNSQAQQIRESINRIDNDKVRLEFQSKLAKAQKALAEFQSQPRYMQELGSVEDAMTYLGSLIDNIMDRINKYYNEHPHGIRRIISNGNSDSMSNMGKPFSGSPNGL